MTLEQYLLMCDQMGWEPKEEEMPLESSDLSLENQQALLLLNALPDMWDGMSGSWLGKDYSGLSAIIEIYNIEDTKQVFELLQVAEGELGNFYRQKQKENSKKK